jgi:hypothetical protein
MMRKTFVLILVLAAVGAIYAREGKNVKLTGYLIDNACAGAHAKDADFGKRVEGHSVSCALMPGCEASGYAIYSDDKLYKLDDKGNKIAVDLLKASKPKKGFHVQAEGQIEGDTLHVSSLSEVIAAKSAD